MRSASWCVPPLPLCKQAGISGYRIHDLRHTYASYAVAKGYALLLGHRSPPTTLLYMHLDVSTLRAATQKIGAMLRSRALPVPEVVSATD